VLWASGPFPFDAFGWAELVTSQDTKTQPIDHLTTQLTAWHCSSSSRWLCYLLLLLSDWVATSCRGGGEGRGPEGDSLHTGSSSPMHTAATRTTGAWSRRFASEHRLLPSTEEATALLSPWLMRFRSSYFITYEGSRRGRLSVVHGLYSTCLILNAGGLYLSFWPKLIDKYLFTKFYCFFHLWPKLMWTSSIKEIHRDVILIKCGLYLSFWPKLIDEYLIIKFCCSCSFLAKADMSLISKKKMKVK
jgi:hypothetical protein